LSPACVHRATKHGRSPPPHRYGRFSTGRRGTTQAVLCYVRHGRGLATQPSPPARLPPSPTVWRRSRIRNMRPYIPGEKSSIAAIGACAGVHDTALSIRSRGEGATTAGGQDRQYATRSWAHVHGAFHSCEVYGIAPKSFAIRGVR